MDSAWTIQLPPGRMGPVRCWEIALVALKGNQQETNHFGGRLARTHPNVVYIGLPSQFSGPVGKVLPAESLSLEFESPNSNPYPALPEQGRPAGIQVQDSSEPREGSELPSLSVALLPRHQDQVFGWIWHKTSGNFGAFGLPSSLLSTKERDVSG